MPTQLSQCMNLHVFFLCQHLGRAPLLAGVSLLTASLDRTPPDHGYLLQEVGDFSGLLQTRGEGVSFVFIAL